VEKALAPHGANPARDSPDRRGAPKAAVSEFDDHALWLQELDDYRISDKFLKLDEEQQGFVLTCMNEHADWLQQMAAPQPDPDSDPSLKPTTAATDAEQQLN
jgi:hypothetical protein